MMTTRRGGLRRTLPGLPQPRGSQRASECEGGQPSPLYFLLLLLLPLLLLILIIRLIRLQPRSEVGSQRFRLRIRLRQRLDHHCHRFWGNVVATTFLSADLWCDRSSLESVLRDLRTIPSRLASASAPPSSFFLTPMPTPTANADGTGKPSESSPSIILQRRGSHCLPCP